MARDLFKGSIGSVNVEVQITSHAGLTKDISDYFRELEIIEDIANLSITGSILFIDSEGVKEFLPIVGGEIIQIKFKTDDDFKEFNNKFKIIKLATESKTDNNWPIIRLYFSSYELLTNYEKKISKSYNGMDIGSIVSDIYHNILKGTKELMVDWTQGTVNYIIPFIRPLDAIKVLQNKSISAYYNDSGYLFYEDGNNYNFVSLSRLYADKVFKTFEFSTPAKNGVLTVMTPNYIKGYNILVGIDMLENIKQGQTGSTIYTFDYSTKSYMHKTISDIEAYSNKYGTTIGHKTMFRKNYNNPESAVREFTEYIQDRNVDGIVNSPIIDIASRAYLSNSRLYASINNNCILLNKDGDSELRCGQVIFANFRSAAEEKVFDEKMVGKYLVRSVRHIITDAEGYKQVVLIFKPGYEQDSTKTLGDTK